MERDFKITINIDYDLCMEKHLLNWRINAFPFIDSQLELSEEEWTTVINHLEYVQTLARNQKRKVKEENNLKIKEAINEVTGVTMKEDLIKKSKFLSLILRHKPSKIGLVLDKNGWADVKELLEKAQMDIKTLEKVVATNDKKRFAFNDDKTKIRASQGHSIKVNLELKPVKPPDILYHGTVDKYMLSIVKKGLIKGKRQHVHLSEDMETANKVGSRRGEPLILMIDAKSMFLVGHKFFLSKNEVWLTDHISPKYITESKKSYGMGQ